LVRRYGVIERLGLPESGLRRFGVPPGGAFDVEAMAVANALVGNVPAEPAWELGMAQGTFRAERDGVVGIAGAVAAVNYRGDRFESGCAFSVAADEEFTIEASSAGARVYVSYGFQARPPGWRIRLDEPTDGYMNRGFLRVVEGPQAGLFDRRALEWPFSVSRTGNRVGIRLEPGIQEHGIELTSEPQCVGAIQVSNDGTLIVIGPEGPTIGGYPKVAVVVTADIPRLAQLCPGDPVRLEFVTVEAARRLAADARARLDRRLRMIRLSGI